MQDDKETQKVRVKNILINFQRGAPPETAGVDIEKCVNEAYDFFRESRRVGSRYPRYVLRNDH
jgi:hypothetical protein